MASPSFAPPPSSHWVGVGAWVKMTDIAHPVITMANSTSETWYQLANDASDDHVVLYSSEIHGVLAEISQYDIAICLNWAIHTCL